jgi:cell division protein FtsB
MPEVYEEELEQEQYIIVEEHTPAMQTGEQFQAESAYIVVIGLLVLCGALLTFHKVWGIVKAGIVSQLISDIEDLEEKFENYKKEMDTVRANTNDWIKRLEDDVKKHNDIIIALKAKAEK